MTTLTAEVSNNLFVEAKCLEPGTLVKGSDVQGIKKLYKILHKSMVHNDFKYKEGLNVLQQPFNPNGSCRSGGLYISTEPHNFIDFGTLLADVQLPEDALVWVESGKLKVDKLILSNIREIPDVVYLLAVSKCARLKDIPIQRITYDICLAAVRRRPLAIHDVPEKFRSDEIVMIAKHYLD